MFSLPQEPSFGLVFINLILLFLVFSFQKKALKEPFRVPKTNRVISIIIMFIFVLFPFWGEDWFHYSVGYESLLLGDSGHMETIYVWIAQHLSVGYISFRFAVWGTGLILLLLTIDRMPLEKDLILLFFGAIWIIWYSYARVSLGLALGYWGLAVFYYPYKNRFFSKLISIFAILISFYFHKSAFVLIFAIALTIISFNLKRRTFVLVMLLTLPIVIILIRSNIASFYLLDTDANEEGFGQSLYYGQYYLGSGQNFNKGGIGALISTFLASAPYYLLLIQCVLLTAKSTLLTAPKVVQSFIRFYIIMVLIASMFALNIGVDSSTLFVRFLRFAAFPSAVVLAYFWENNFYPKITKWTFYIAILSTLYSVSYSMYLNGLRF